MKKFYVIFFSLILIVLVQRCSFAIDSNNIIDIKVENKVIKQINSNQSFVGVNLFNDCEINNLFINNPEHLDYLAKVLKDLNIDILRYPSGIMVTSTFWDVPNTEMREALRKLPKFEQGWLTLSGLRKDDRMDFLPFMEFCKKHNFKATVQVNVHNYFDKQKKEIIMLKQYKRDPYTDKRLWATGVINWEIVKLAAKNAAEQVKFVKDNGYHNNVQYWEMGNEDFNKQWLNCNYTASEYAKVSAIFIREMRKIDPNIKIIITNMVRPDDYKHMPSWLNIKTDNDWSKEVINNPELKKYKSNIYAISNHIYPDGNWVNITKETPFEKYRQNILYNENLDVKKRINFHEQMLKSSGYNPARIFINEFNCNQFENQNSHSWLGALGVAKMVLSCSDATACEHMDFHVLLHYYKGINIGYGMLHYASGFDFPFITYPSGYVLGFLNKNIKGDVLKVSFTPQTVYSSAYLNGNNIKVMVLNLGEDRQFKLSFSGFVPLTYLNNESIGTNIPETFKVMDSDDKMQNPQEVRLINTLNNAIKIEEKKDFYLIKTPENTLSVFTFKK